VSTLTMNLLGFPAVNKDLTVELRDAVTQNVIKTAQPFTDGTVHIPQVNPGAYEVVVSHPNLTLPVIRRPIRILPDGDTKVAVLIDPSKFRNTPIEETPEANLGPINDLAASVGETIGPVANKKAGEAILAQDWNQLAAGIRDMSGAMQELTKVVSPVGHDHPEYIKKFDEVTTNFQNLLDTLSSAFVELQRQIQTMRLRSHITEVLDAAGVDPKSATGKDMLGIVDQLDTQVTASPTTFGREFRNAAVQIDTKLSSLVTANQNKPEFTGSPAVKQLSTAVDLAKQNRASTYEGELLQYKQMDRTLGGALQKVSLR
jgi:hypothetical protein